MKAYRFRKGYSREIREAVFARDKGICHDCGLDTEAERIKALYGAGLSEYSRGLLRIKWRDAGMPSCSTSWWQADHVHELADGGNHDLGNLLTRCVPCHKRKTAQAATARAAKRRGRP